MGYPGRKTGIFGTKTAENLCLGFGCWVEEEGYFAKVSGRLNARFTVQAAFECRKSSLHFYGIEYVWPRNGLFILRHSRFS